MPDRKMRRHRQALHPERTFDLLVPEVPEVTFVTPGRELIVSEPEIYNRRPWRMDSGPAA